MTRITPVSLRVLMLTLMLAVLAPAPDTFAAAPSPSDLALDARLRGLEEELRCLVCQNQTLADSNAPLAEDLRREVRELAVAGRSDAEIRAYLTARYGDFVLYRPPLRPRTWLLWFGPALLLVAGAWLWWRVGRRPAVGSAGAGDAAAPAMRGDGVATTRMATPADDDAARERGRELLDR